MDLLLSHYFHIVCKVPMYATPKQRFDMTSSQEISPVLCVQTTSQKSIVVSISSIF